MSWSRDAAAKDFYRCETERIPIAPDDQSGRLDLERSLE